VRHGEEKVDKETGVAATRAREIVEKCIRRELPSGGAVPGDAEDLVDSGVLDSMGWLGALRCIEQAAGIGDLADLMPGDAPRSIQSLALAVREAISRHVDSDVAPEAAPRPSGLPGAIGGWGATLGSLRVEVGAVEREYSLRTGTLRQRAGIESVARASRQEDEVSLALSACQKALRVSEIDVSDLDWVVAVSETFCRLPSLGSSLHSRLLARDTCGVLDVGGACVGLLNGLWVGGSLIGAGVAHRVLVATADVHSRHFVSGRVDGEFGGLFGDGSSAFVVSRAEDSAGAQPYRLGHFQFGCAGAFSSALAVRLSADQALSVKFEGEALARAAVSRLERILADLELRSGLSRTMASGFATHQPNPRLVNLLARQAGLPLEKFPAVSRTCGNLGSSTCGVALARLLDEYGHRPSDQRGPIFLAAVGPGMLWGGGILH
jgi:3-oxoacyl-[acyl-carrier-protein] synthase III